MSVAEIVAEHKRRHDHWRGQTEQCPYCSSFVALSTEGQFKKGVCPRCEKAVLKYAQR